MVDIDGMSIEDAIEMQLSAQGFVVVDRARFERLRKLAELGKAWDATRESPSLVSGNLYAQMAFIDGLRDVLDADVNPLP